MTSQQFNFQSVKQRTFYDGTDQQQQLPQQFTPKQNFQRPMLMQQQQQQMQYKQKNEQKTRLYKKTGLEGFQLIDIVWVRPAEGRFKYQVLVKYIDPEAPKTKRIDGSYQKIVKFGQKGNEDFVDPPHNPYIKQRNIKRIKSNGDNPLHPNFYFLNLLNGPSNDIQLNLNTLKRNIFS